MNTGHVDISMCTDNFQKIKMRVRLAKVALRGVNFSCSLIILAMVSASFTIFNTTKSLPSQSGMPAWAEGTDTWPQKLVLAMSCVSLLACIIVFLAYCRGGHRRAEKVATYYTMFAIGWVSGILHNYAENTDFNRVFLVHRQHGSLGRHCSPFPKLEEQLQQQRHVGMGLRRQHSLNRFRGRS